MTYKIKIIFLFVLSVVLTDCRKKITGEKNRFENSIIKMEKGECYGTCPVYSITISGTGKAVYEGKKDVKKVGTFEKQLSPKEISKLFNAFECANFFDFQSEYDAKVSDVPTTWLTFEHRGFKRQVKDRYDAPEELKHLENMVAEIALSEEGWNKVSDK